MKLKLKLTDDDQIDMSPLIDCVFLLLIFFLVATMLKKWQMQIPVQMPNISSNLSQNPEESILLLGIDTEGKLYRQNGKTPSGFPVFSPVSDLSTFLSSVPKGSPLRILSERNTPFQYVITMLDTCQVSGFNKTELKLLSGKIRKEGDRR